MLPGPSRFPFRPQCKPKPVGVGPPPPDPGLALRRGEASTSYDLDVIRTHEAPPEKPVNELDVAYEAIPVWESKCLGMALTSDCLKNQRYLTRTAWFRLCR